MSTGRSGSTAWHSWTLLLAGLLLLALTLPLRAQTGVEEQARAIAAQLRCPVCQNLSVADSSSELARDMRGVIRDQLRAGKTEEEIKAYFVSKYGDWILLSPRPRGLSLLLWVGPFAAAAVGLAVAIGVARRWARRPSAPERRAADPVLLERVRHEALGDDAERGVLEPEGLPPLELERRRLYAVLRELDFDHRSGKLSRADYEAMREEYEARAAAVLSELDRQESTPAPVLREPATGRGASGLRAGGGPRPRRPWRLATAGVFLLVFGLSLGYFLSQSLRPRSGDGGSVTGDALTGTGPGGMAPGSRVAARDPDALIASGRAAYQRQEWRGALDAFQQALALDPRNPEAHSLVALVLLHTDHADEALRAVDRALATNPSYPLALWVKGIVLFEAKQDYRGAIQAWEALMTRTLAAEDADEVARMLTEARTRLAAPRSAPRG